MAYNSKYTGAELEKKLDAINDIPTIVDSKITGKGYVTKGDILCIIKDLIGSGGGEGGGYGTYLIGLNDYTTPTEKNAYSAIRADHRFLSKESEDSTSFLIKLLGGIVTTIVKSTRFAEGIVKSGWSIDTDKDSYWKLEIDKIVARVLAYVENLYVKEHATFVKSLSSEEFISGFVEGKGWAIRMKEYINSTNTKELRSVGEFDDLIVRGTLRVFEFIISQLLGENDNRIFTAMMEVDHYDAEEGKIYMSTQEGRLYNPFRVGDVVMVQQYNGMPSEENDYYITKQYEFIVTEVGIGEEGEDRLDWLKFDNFTSPMENASTELIAYKDTLVRLDNLYDPRRKGIIQIITVGEDTPYMDIIYGRKTDPDNYLKGRFGNLGGIYNALFGWLKEFGAYLTNLYAIGEFRIAHTGEDIADSIEMLKGSFRTNFSQTSYDISEESDFFTNASFTNNCEYWELSEEETFYFSVGDIPQFFNYELYASENSFAGIASYEGRNALRLNNGTAKQLNKYISKPNTHKEYNNLNETTLEKVETDVVDTLYLSVRAYAERSGTLEFGFIDSNGNFINNSFYKIESLEESKDAYTFKLSGKWDSIGDFLIKSTGDIYIDLLSLTDKPLENFRITTSTAIEQDAKSIKLLGTRIDGANQTITTVQQTVNAQAGTISSIARRVSSTETNISNLTISVNGISSTVSTKVGKNEIISSINQSSESVTINASKINLNGVVTANRTFKIDTSGYMTCIGGTIGGFSIDSSSLKSSSTTGSLTLSADLLKFTGNVGTVFVGSDVIPDYSSYMDGPMRIEVNRTNGTIGNCGLLIDVRGASEYDDFPIDSGNNALYIANGKISGFRLRTRRVGTSTTLSKMVSNYIYTGTSEGTFTLPSGCEDGQEYRIKSANGARLNVSPSANITPSSGAIINDQRIHLYIYDKINNKWHSGYIES